MAGEDEDDRKTARARWHGVAALLLLLGAAFFLTTESVAGAALGIVITAGAGVALLMARRAG